MTQSLVHSLRAGADDGRVVPVVYQNWSRLGINPRFGQVMMLAAGPGGMKSAVITDYVRKLGLPTLYFSADTDRTTMALRIISGVTKFNQQVVETGLDGVNRDWWLQQATDATKHIWFCWDASPGYGDADAEIDAYAVVHGEYPQIVVVDNLKDLGAINQGGGGAEHVVYDNGVQYCHELARRTGALVIILHHVLGKYENGDQAIPLDGLKGKVGKTPRVILTLYRRFDNKLGICLVKNTAGPAMTDASLQTAMYVDPTTWQFMEA